MTGLEFRETSPCQASRPSHIKKKTPKHLIGFKERQRRGMHTMCEGGDRRRVKEAACEGRRTRKNTWGNRREEEVAAAAVTVTVTGGGRETWKRAAAARTEKRSGGKALNEPLTLILLNTPGWS